MNEPEQYRPTYAYNNLIRLASEIAVYTDTFEESIERMPTEVLRTIRSIGQTAISNYIGMNQEINLELMSRMQREANKAYERARDGQS